MSAVVGAGMAFMPALGAAIEASAAGAGAGMLLSVIGAGIGAGAVCGAIVLSVVVEADASGLVVVVWAIAAVPTISEAAIRKVAFMK